jgi:hypothetical protein
MTSMFAITLTLLGSMLFLTLMLMDRLIPFFKGTLTMVAMGVGAAAAVFGALTLHGDSLASYLIIMGFCWVNFLVIISYHRKIGVVIVTVIMCTVMTVLAYVALAT